MIFSGHSLNDISLDDIRALVDNRMPEGLHLDYKEAPYGSRPQDRREMLRDITALANAEGGYLILGIREDGFGRAMEITPFNEPRTIAQAIRLSCLDSVRDRIEGLEVRDYETGFNQGLVVIRVPVSNQRPHMMISDGRTEFTRRYDTDKRPMTIGEIRETILSNPSFRQLVELELQSRWKINVDDSNTKAIDLPYVRIFTEHAVERFLQKYLLGGVVAQALMIVSPFIGSLAGTSVELGAITKKVEADHSRLYVITREPQESYHKEGLTVLEQCSLAEIRYNPDIHAKLYIVWSRIEEESFALFGSGNLTESGLRHNIELGMMVLARGHGKTIVRDLYQWSSATLRSQSRRIKEIHTIPHIRERSAHQ